MNNSICSKCGEGYEIAKNVQGIRVLRTGVHLSTLVLFMCNLEATNTVVCTFVIHSTK
jgi:hypothetical protein